MRMRPTQVVRGPDGEVLTLSDLPSTPKVRWVARRKAQVVAAVRGGIIDMAEACRRFGLSAEEFLSWERQLKVHGLRGLKAGTRPSRGSPRKSITEKICAEIRGQKQINPRVKVSDFQLRIDSAKAVLLNLKTGKEQLLDCNEGECGEIGSIAQ